MVSTAAIRLRTFSPEGYSFCDARSQKNLTTNLNRGIDLFLFSPEKREVLEVFSIMD